VPVRDFLCLCSPRMMVSSGAEWLDWERRKVCGTGAKIW
jgi:hypothetical protein